MIEIKIHGLAELKARIKQLPVKIGRKVLRKGVAAGAGVVRRAAKLAAPLGETGTLRRSAIIKFVRRDSNDTQAVYIVTFRRGKKAREKGRDAYYAPWVEFGHKIGRRRGKVHGTIPARRRAANAAAKRVPPHPFFGPAFKQSGQAATEAMKAKLTLELNKLPEFSR